MTFYSADAIRDVNWRNERSGALYKKFLTHTQHEQYFRYIVANNLSTSIVQSNTAIFDYSSASSRFFLASTTHVGRPLFHILIIMIEVMLHTSWTSQHLRHRHIIFEFQDFFVTPKLAIRLHLIVVRFDLNIMCYPPEYVSAGCNVNQRSRRRSTEASSCGRRSA